MPNTTGISSRTRIRPYCEKNWRTRSRTGTPGRSAGTEVASKPRAVYPRKREGRAAWPAPTRFPGFGLAAGRLDALHELESAVLDLVQTLVRDRRVAVLVDVVRAEHA